MASDSFKLAIELTQTLVRSSLVALEKSSAHLRSLQKKTGHDLSFAGHRIPPLDLSNGSKALCRRFLSPHKSLVISTRRF